MASTQCVQKAPQGRLPRLKMIVAGFAFMAILATVFGVQAWRQKLLVETLEKKLSHQLAVADCDLAEERQEAGNMAGAAALLVRAQKNDPEYSRARNLWWKAANIPIYTPEQRFRSRAVINSAAISSNGQWVVTTSRDKTARVWNAHTGEPLGTPLVDEEARHCFQSVAISPDGQRVVTTTDCYYYAWDSSKKVKTGEYFINAKGGANPVAFSPDGKKVVMGMENGTSIFDSAIANFDALTELLDLSHEAEVLSANFSSDSQLVITVTAENSAQIWDASTGKPRGPELKTTGGVISANFSPDAKLVVTASADKTAQVWDALTGKPLGLPLLHKGKIVAAGFSHDAKWVITAAKDSPVQNWDIATGKLLGSALQPEIFAKSAGFSPDGRWMVTVSEDNVVQAWETASGKPCGPTIGHEDILNYATFSPDGRNILTVSKYSGVSVWDALSGKPAGPSLEVESASFSPDGKWLLIVSNSSAQVLDTNTRKPIGSVFEKDHCTVESANFSTNGLWVEMIFAGPVLSGRLWDVATGKPLGPEITDPKESILKFSPDGLKILTVATESIKIWDTVTGEQIGKTGKHNGNVIDMILFYPDSMFFIMVSRDTAQVWDSSTGEPVGNEMRIQTRVTMGDEGELIGADYLPSADFDPVNLEVVTAADNTARIWTYLRGDSIGQAIQHKDFINSVCFSPDGEKIITSSKDCSAQVWDSFTGKPHGLPLLHSAAVHSAIFSPDGEKILTVTEQAACIWNTRKNETQRSIYAFRLAVFSPDGRLVAATERDPNYPALKFWDSATGEPLGPEIQDVNTFDSFFFSPDGKYLLTRINDTAQIWDVNTGERCGKMLNNIKYAAFSPDAQMIVTTSSGTAQIRDVASGESRAALEHKDLVFSAAFSPDGRSIVTTSADRACIWNIASSEARITFQHKDAVIAAAFSPDGRLIVTASSDTARIWDVASGKSLVTFQHQDTINSVAFSADGRWVVTASSDKTTRIWDVATGKASGDPILHEGAVISAHFSSDGKFVVTEEESEYENRYLIWDSATRECPELPFEYTGGSLILSPDSHWVLPIDSLYNKVWLFSFDPEWDRFIPDLTLAWFGTKIGEANNPEKISWEDQQAALNRINAINNHSTLGRIINPKAWSLCIEGN